jgi:hypothetical protein
VERAFALGENNGRRRLQFVVTDLEDQRTTRDVTFEQVFLDFNALVVGVTAYDRAAPVSFADRDARAVAGAFTDRLDYDKRNVTLLENAEASASKLKSALNALTGAGKTKAEGTFVLWFSGQVMEAGGEVYLLPCDANPDDLENTAISIKKLGDALGKIRSKRKILLIDAADTPAGLSDALRKLPDCVTITGGGDGEFRDTDRDRELGLFAKHFIEGIDDSDTNNDGLVAVDEVFAHVRRDVRDKSFDSQTPALVTRAGGGRAPGYYLGKKPSKR